MEEMHLKEICYVNRRPIPDKMDFCHHMTLLTIMWYKDSRILLGLATPEICLTSHSLTQGYHTPNASHHTVQASHCGNSPYAVILPVTVSFSGLSQSKMTNEGHPSTVTTVRLVGGFCGGLVAFPSVASSLGKRLTESVMEQGLLSGFGMYRT